VDHEEVVRVYGPWLAHTPADVVELQRGYPGRWWVAGGWAIEAFTGIPRPHGDIDLSIPRSDVALFWHHLFGRMHVWEADAGTLRPLVGAETAVAQSCGNLWLRRSGADPWEYDVLLAETDEERWIYKRDPRIALPIEDIVWRKDGVGYLRPEIQLLHKARGLRSQDQHDFDACLPLLSTPARTWLHAALDVAHPGHPWAVRLATQL